MPHRVVEVVEVADRDFPSRKRGTVFLGHGFQGRDAGYLQHRHGRLPADRIQKERAGCKCCGWRQCRLANTYVDENNLLLAAQDGLIGHDAAVLR